MHKRIKAKESTIKGGISGICPIKSEAALNCETIDGRSICYPRNGEAVIIFLGPGVRS